GEVEHPEQRAGLRLQLDVFLLRRLVGAGGADCEEAEGREQGEARRHGGLSEACDYRRLPAYSPSHSVLGFLSKSQCSSRMPTPLRRRTASLRCWLASRSRSK